MKTSMWSENFTSVEKDDLVIYMRGKIQKDIRKQPDGRSQSASEKWILGTDCYWLKQRISNTEECNTVTIVLVEHEKHNKKRTLLIFVATNSWLEAEHQCLFWPTLMSEFWTLFRNNAILCQAIRTCNFEELKIFSCSMRNVRISLEKSR